MAAQLNTVFQQLRRIALIQNGAGLSDGQLLEMFVSQKDEAAFEALVRRHGSMVMKVSRRVVGNHHDAEDVFQTTFLVLSRKAASIRPREMVANWLHGVAFNTALNARKLKKRRWDRERQVSVLPHPVQSESSQDLYPILDQELQRLADIYRLPILLCDLEGNSIKSVTQQLGWPQGTVAGRLARGRQILAKRLARHGLAMAGGIVALQNSASACVSPVLVASTVKAASVIASGKSVASSLISANVAVLLKGALSAMSLTKLKITAAALVVGSVFALGGGMLLNGAAGGAQVEVRKNGGDDPSIKQVAKPTEKEAASTKTDHAKLRGTWRLVKSIFHGKTEAPIKVTHWWIGKDKIVMNPAVFSTRPSPDDNEYASYHFWGDNADSAPSPNNINMTIQVVQESGDDKRRFVRPRTLRGIYAVDGDSLTLCFGAHGDRPTEIPVKSFPEDMLFIWVLQRETAAPTTDKEKLQGEWSVVRWKIDGEQVPLQWPFKPHVHFVGDLKTSWDEGEEIVFRLNTTTSPKQITLTDRSGNVEQKSVGIYTLSGDDLTICLSLRDDAVVPDRFTAPKGSRRGLMVLKRVKAAEEGAPSSKGRNAESAEAVEPAQRKANNKGDIAGAWKEEEAAAKVVREKLRGAWKVVSTAAKGNQAFPKNTKWVFWDEKIDLNPALFQFFNPTLFAAGERERHQTDYSLGRDKRDVQGKTSAPNGINLSIPITLFHEDGSVKAHGTVTYRCIFECENNRLKLCGRLGNAENVNRPTDIPNVPGNNSDLWVIVLERE